MRKFPAKALRSVDPREYYRQYNAAYRDLHPERTRKQRAKSMRWLHYHWRHQLFVEFGPCRRCGYADPRALQIDHVYGGGTKEGLGRQAFSRGIYNKVRARFASGELQILCANCNWVKRSENRELQIVKPHADNE